MSDLHDLRARAGEFERSITETDDQHGSLLSGLESGLSTLRQRLVEAKAENDRLARENLDLKAVAERLLDTLENKPAETLHDKLAALGGQIHGLLEFSGDPSPADGAPVNGTPVTGTRSPSADGATPRLVADLGGTFDDIRERMRALSDQLLAPAAQAVAAQVHGLEPGPASTPTGARPSIRLPESERRVRRSPGSPRAFDRPIKALTEKAQNVLPKVRLRFDAETDYALSILRRLKGGSQPFSVEEVRELINGKFGLTLTDRHNAQLCASLANQDGVTRGPRVPQGHHRGDSAEAAQSWRFETG